MPTLVESFGAMFYHCGLLGTAAPGPCDTHPLHGELPQALMGAAAIELEEESSGTRLRITGTYEHARAFTAHYRAQPSIALVADEAKVEVVMHVTNLSEVPFRFAYLGHPNFRPVDGVHLHYSAPYDAAHVRVRQKVPAYLVLQLRMNATRDVISLFRGRDGSWRWRLGRVLLSTGGQSSRR